MPHRDDIAQQVHSVNVHFALDDQYNIVLCKLWLAS